MKTFLGSVLVASVLATTVAHADPAPGDDVKSEAVATELALGATVAGAAMMIGAVATDPMESSRHGASVPLGVTGATLLLLGPSFGHWYAHKAYSKGLLIRGIGGATFGLGMFGYALDHSFQGNTDRSLPMVAVVGAAVFLGGALLDIAQARDAVRSYNREHAGMQLSIAPTVVRSGGGAQPGVGIVGRF
jgi:hypothetical protein